MSIYNRDSSLSKVLSDATDNVKDLKSTQIVGNDNLYIRHYQDVIPDDVVVGEALYKATFTFDEQSTAYVQFSIYWETSDVFNYEEFFYDDPSTLESNLAHSFYMAISISEGGLLENITAICDSTEPGELTFSRIS